MSLCLYFLQKYLVFLILHLLIVFQGFWCQLNEWDMEVEKTVKQKILIYRLYENDESNEIAPKSLNW